MSHPDFTDTVPGELTGVPTVPGVLWSQADGVDGQCGFCVTQDGTGSVTLNCGGQRMTLRVSQSAMVAVSATSAAAAKAMARFRNNAGPEGLFKPPTDR